ncbi:Sin3 associated polypeptide p18-domain-containing protein [Ampelomyces quisqualis]|uniref:Sin3 associated polypeptide p18-domain-containing protein n=1 Tax=Ampelomyces quisqualis TaxID=50730 RepID=A0A6A5QJQ0_AMPQU|nr:Sin3 associated polypeptide p18-domain-containing protein [Ampelomyces quisqualis]
MAAQAPAKIDRQTTTPFLLRLFYKQDSFHRLDEFDPSLTRPPQHLQIYTWQSCSLRELCTLLLSAVPTQLPQPYTGARIAFRLVYPDIQGSNRPDAPGRFISRDIGSVIVGARGRNDDADMHDGDRVTIAEALKQLDGDPDRTLADVKFLTGDYVACAILPPLPDGSVPAAPPPVAAPGRGGPPSGPYGGARGRENGFNARGDFGSGRGRGGRFDDRLGSGVPSGEWRRGEAPPERELGFGKGRGRGDGGDWRSGGRGGGRW